MRVDLETGGVSLYFYPGRLSLGAIASMTGIDCVFRDLLGRVTVPGGDTFLSYSRTENLTVVAKSSVPVGVDVEIQRPRPRLMAMAERYFTDDDVQYLKARGSERRLMKALWGMWTAKEAYAKASGIPLTEVVGSVTFTPAPLDWWHYDGRISVRHIHFSDAIVAIAVARPVHDPFTDK